MAEINDGQFYVLQDCPQPHLNIIKNVQMGPV